MKKITLLLVLLLSVTLMNAQTPVELDWLQGANGADYNFTISTGDTVQWIWMNASGHNVQPQDGENDAPADFGTDIIAQNGFVYEYTFTEVAEIDYWCTPHLNNMFGTITIEEALSIEDKFEMNLAFYPNPVSNDMTIKTLIKFDTYEIYDLNGRKLGGGIGEGTFTNLDASYLKSGMYFIKVTAGDLTTTKRFMKR